MNECVEAASLNKLPYMLPPIRDIQRQFDFSIPKSTVLNRPAYQITRLKIKKANKQVMRPISRGSILESMILCCLNTSEPRKDSSSNICVDTIAIYKTPFKHVLPIAWHDMLIG